MSVSLDEWIASRLKSNRNLKPFQPGEQRAREAGRAGGIASGEARRRKRERIKTIKASLAALGSFEAL